MRTVCFWQRADRAHRAVVGVYVVLCVCSSRVVLWQRACERVNVMNNGCVELPCLLLLLSLGSGREETKTAPSSAPSYPPSTAFFEILSNVSLCPATRGLLNMAPLVRGSLVRRCAGSASVQSRERKRLWAAWTLNACLSCAFCVIGGISFRNMDVLRSGTLGLCIVGEGRKAMSSRRRRRRRRCPCRSARPCVG